MLLCTSNIYTYKYLAQINQHILKIIVTLVNANTYNEYSVSI